MAAHLTIDRLAGTEGKVTLQLRGELDMQGAPRLQQVLEESCQLGAREITLDLRELEFIDSSGLRAIILGRDVCAGHSCGYFLIRSRARIIQRLFTIAGVDDELPFRDGAGASAELPDARGEQAAG